jgi:CDP-diacylglycerol--glycerol-3-phosphate 3-phosphatidyltransferase
MNLPNSITLSRLLGLPLILYWLHQGTEIDRWLSLIIFLIAASTDWLDGYLATKIQSNHRIREISRSFGR